MWPRQRFGAEEEARVGGGANERPKLRDLTVIGESDRRVSESVDMGAAGWVFTRTGNKHQSLNYRCCERVEKVLIQNGNSKSEAGMKNRVLGRAKPH